MTAQAPFLLDHARWRMDAACRGADPDLFHPTSGGAGRVLAAEARKVCAGCEVRQDCLAYALATGTNEGIWGGLTPAERGSRRLPRPITHGTESGARTHWRRSEAPCDACRRAANAACAERAERRSA